MVTVWRCVALEAPLNQSKPLAEPVRPVNGNGHPAEQRRAKRRLARRDIILEAARRVFARRGPLAASITEIAQEADYSKAAIYFYFRNKEEIYLTLVLQGQDTYYDLLSDRLTGREDRPGLENLRIVWDCLLELAAAQPDFFTFASALQTVDLAPDAPSEVVDAVNTRARAIFGLIRQVIRWGQARGEFARVADGPTALAIWSAFIGGIQLHQTQQRFSGRPLDRAGLLESMFSLVAHGLAVRSEGKRSTP